MLRWCAPCWILEEIFSPHQSPRWIEAIFFAVAIVL